MEKRTCERIPVSFAGDLLSDNMFNTVIITDVSEGGLCSIIAASNVPVDLMPDLEFNMRIQLDSRKAIYLSCEEIWSNNINNVFMKKVGWKINNPPAEYNDLVKSL